jgi:hypothetical protein
MARTINYLIKIPYYSLLAGAMSGVITLGLLIINPKTISLIGRKFLSLPEFWVWAFLVIVSMMLITILMIPMWISLNGFKVSIKKHLGSLIISATLLLFMLLAPSLLNTQIANFDFRIILPEHHSFRMYVILFYSFIAILPAFLGIILIQIYVLNLVKETTSGGDETQIELVKELLDSRDQLQTYLLILGILVSLITIATGGLRSLVLTLSENLHYPVSLVIIYGLYFSFLLIIIYSPAHLALSQAAKKLRDAVYPIESMETLAEDTEKRKNFDVVFQLNKGLGITFQNSIILLSPLLTSLLSSLLGVSF